MAIEIELKAWVDNPEACKNILSLLAGPPLSFEKADSYWFFRKTADRPPPGIRIRRERSGGKEEPATRISYKSKEVREGIEVNNEREFTVSDGAAFEEFLARLGFERDMEKHKRGWAWICGDITAELCELRSLGWFAELEILADNDGPETVAAARKRLLELLGKIGIGEDKIESRYYTELLRRS
ncbi:MAG: class IV adenylate cyclase [Treponema sp.]|jgi:adenylate cyclase class 2|nr:class IV adenylate cyclase [Treponema sp.]